MSTIKKLAQLFIILTLLAGGLAFVSRPAAAEPVYTCLPTCDEKDTRMLTIASASLSTMADQPVRLSFASPADAATIEIGIFDGDTGGYWDLGTTLLEYTLFADPIHEFNQSSTNIVGQWLSTDMPDNAWFTVTLPNSPLAKSPSGNYFYHLRISVAGSGTYSSNFKVRTDGVETLIAQPFAFTPSMYKAGDRAIVYPSYPALSPTSYDGTFSFFVYVPSSRASFSTWDGDFDFGSDDLQFRDTDDPDTPNGIKPLWILTPGSINFEGVAVGANGSTGTPSDDNSFASGLYRRSPSIVYDVVIPGGEIYSNNNPSGNQEWEQFLIATDVNLAADVHREDPLPAGLYQMRVRGGDLVNMNVLRFEFEILGVCVASEGEQPQPCKTPLYPYLVGDTVFTDLNGDGVQNDGENGIPGVVMYLLDKNGNPVLDVDGQPLQAATDANGYYEFSVSGKIVDEYSGEVLNDGEYTVQVASQNFDPGGALEYQVSTTGGEEQTKPVINANIMTFDFGYQPPHAIGDTVFNDLDGNGTQGSDEPGIPGVAVDLLNGSGILVGTATTDADGKYSFRVVPGDYTVQIAASNFDSSGSLYNMASTTGGHTLTDTVATADVLTFDFGYRVQYIIGDTLFNDLDADGVQDAGEMGIAGVTVELLNSAGEVLGNTTTDAGGAYSFIVFSGDYTVQVASSNFNLGGVLAGMVSTTGGHVQTGTVSDADVLTYDFGYSKLYTIGDLVFKDCDRNGIQAGVQPSYRGDCGCTCVETGIANVKLELIDSAGQVIVTTTTDAYGFYRFDVLPGAHTVRVAGSNFDYGKPLYGMVSTIDANQLIRTVTDADILTYDFPYGSAITNPGTGTIGYWKNHPEAWPVGSIEIGGKTYTRDEAIAMMKTSTSKDKTVNLFSQLVATKLNILIGNASSCIQRSVKLADQWLAKYPYGSNVSASSAAWQSISTTYTYLDRYNNGLMCAPHRG